MEILLKYFKGLTNKQVQQFAQMHELYAEWNSQINLISRKDFEHFYERHVLHSLAIAKVISFKNGTQVLDIGTGGGFPGIPLAILFPQADFVLIDSIGKKIKVVNDVIDKLGLKNVKALQIRAEQFSQSFDFVVSRAVTDLPTFVSWIGYKIRKKGFNDLKNGVLYLKGGSLDDELSNLPVKSRIYPIADYYDEEFFESKNIVYMYEQ